MQQIHLHNRNKTKRETNDLSKNRIKMENKKKKEKKIVCEVNTNQLEQTADDEYGTEQSRTDPNAVMR